MVRLQRSILTVAASASLVALFMFVVLTASSVACSTQETTHAQDAAPATCEKGPHVFCQPVGPEVASCNTDEGTSPFLARLPRATRYPLGCVVNYVGERDPQGDCRNEGVCKCLIAEPLVTNDPVDGGDASVVLPPVGPAPPPSWNCAP